MKYVREFIAPRERVTPEVTRVFQLVQISLQNLERAVNAIQDDSGDFTQLRADLERLARNVSRSQTQPQPQRVRVLQQAGPASITFSSEI